MPVSYRRRKHSTNRKVQVLMQAEAAKPSVEEKKSKIVIIDDDPFQVQLLVSILKDEKHDAIGFSDNLKALAEIEGLMPDLILLDLIMPGMDGFEVCRRIKENPQTGHIPVIFLTAKKDKETES